MPWGSTALGNAGSQAEAAVPALAGQEHFYLERQLLAWRSGWRSNGPNGAMNQVAKLLSDEEIRQLAAYLSGLP
jgi:cytochrome c553